MGRKLGSALTMKGAAPDPILIVGTGAMACLFAAKLSRSGTPVTMLGSWQEGLEAIRRDGVTLVESDGDGIREEAYPVQVVDASSLVDPAPRDATPGAIAPQSVKYALVLVKSWQTRQAACSLQRCLAPGGLALTLQNGLGNREALAEILSPERVALGVNTVGANLAGPGKVRAGGDGSLVIGEHLLLGSLTDLLRKAGFTVEQTSDPDALLWGKLVINAAINPLTALLGVTNGELLKRPTARMLMAGLARETAAVAAAQGIRLPYPDPVAMAESVAERTGANRSSMLQDVQRRAPTEIDAICGNIVEAGEQFGVDTPINRTVWMLVRAMAAGF